MTLVDRDPDRLIGTVLGGRFVIKQCLAVDDAGARYEAWDDEQTSDSTVRILHNVRPDDSSVRKLVELLTEVSGLGIRGIATLRAVGRTRAKDVYYATDAVPGEALSELLAAGPLEPAAAVKAVAAAGEVLVDCHKRGVVHGGLHPGAVVLPAEGVASRVTLLDFGLGPITKAPDALAAGASSASMPYQSPEQASNEPYDHRADVYSLGALLFVALTGRPPFAGSSVLEVLAHQLRGEAPSLAKANPALEGTPLQSIVDQSMQVKPSERFDSVEAMVRALRVAGKEEAGRARAPRRSTTMKAAAVDAASTHADATKPVPRKATDKQKAVGPYRGAGAAKGPALTLREPRRPVWPYVAAGLVVAAAVALYLGWDSLAAATERAITQGGPSSTLARPQVAAVDAGPPTSPPTKEPAKRSRWSLPSSSEAEQAAEDRPLSERASALLAEGNEALAAGRALEAVSRFRSAEREAPDSPMVARGLGFAYAATGDRRNAATAFRRYLELYPDAVDAPSIRARIASLEQRR